MRIPHGPPSIRPLDGVGDLRWGANGGGVNTFFLYTKGYSEMNVRFEGAPAVNELKALKEPGALSDYSKMEYLKKKAEGKVSSM